MTEFTMEIAASDVEPGTVLITITEGGAAIATIPLRGTDLERVAEAFGKACITAFADIAATALRDNDQ